jgi:hypothetical protein
MSLYNSILLLIFWLHQNLLKRARLFTACGTKLLVQTWMIMFSGESPTKVFDSSTATAYANYGTYNNFYGSYSTRCGEDTGLYLSLLRGASLLVAFTISTAASYVERDPVTLTIEGSNQSLLALTFGSSWILIYNGSSDLDSDHGSGNSE